MSDKKYGERAMETSVPKGGAGGVLETHSYDGKLRDLRFPQPPAARIKEQVGHLREMLGRHRDEILDMTRWSYVPQALVCLDRMEKDGADARGPNYDESNDVNALCVLIHILDCVDLEDVGGVLLPIAEQLHDVMRSGPCPQGRGTRMQMLYRMLCVV